MLLRDSFPFSREYLEHLEFKDKVRALVVKAKEELKDYKLYGYKIDTSNPEHIIAVLYLLSKDFNLFHEPI